MYMRLACTEKWMELKGMLNELIKKVCNQVKDGWKVAVFVAGGYVIFDIIVRFLAFLATDPTTKRMLFGFSELLHIKILFVLCVILLISAWLLKMYRK